jgi:DNA-binding Lrp family transcriptional regulator
VHRITGEDCFLLKVHAPSIGELEEILDQFHRGFHVRAGTAFAAAYRHARLTRHRLTCYDGCQSGPFRFGRAYHRDTEGLP